MGEESSRTHDVFLSYSSKDKTWADAACAVLEGHRVRCWIAPRDITHGDEWGAAIIKGLNGSRIMVLIFSGHANASVQVRREVERASSRGMTILAMRIEDVCPEGAMEFALGHRHWLDAFTPPVEKQLELLTRSVKTLLGHDVESPAAPAAAKPAAVAPAKSPDVAPTRRPPWVWPSVAAAFLFGLIALGVFIVTIKDPNGETRLTAPDDKPIKKDGVIVENKPSRGTTEGGAGGSPSIAGETGSPPVGKPPVPPAANMPRIASQEGSRAGEERDDNGLKMKFCWCPPGTFRMGSPPTEPDRDDDEGPVDVTLSRGFWMGTYEVTQSQWQKVMGTSLREQKAKGSIGDITGEGPEEPMYFVSHDEAEEFCRKLTASERAAGRLPAGWEYHLPTEAQWEYACPAGGKGVYCFGDDASRLGDFAWFNKNSEGRTHPVGEKSANQFGLHDMHGNVWEWCADGYDKTLPGGRDPRGPSEAPCRVIRGGGWYFIPGYCRPALRFGSSPGDRLNDLGFRVAAVQ